jgi:MT0933-like antitoxin protein
MNRGGDGPVNTDQPRDMASELRDKATETFDILIEKTGVVLDDLVERGKEFLDKYEDTIGSAIDKVAGFVDDQTKGKYHDTIESVVDKAKDTVGRLAGESGTTSS